MTDALSMRGYARWRAAKGLAGGTHTAVSRAISDGRLQESLLGTAVGKFQIDPELADAEWARNTDAAQSRGGSDADPEQNGGPQASLFPGAGTQVPEEPGKTDAPGGPALARSQQVNALFRARLTQLEYEERSGKLCPVAEVTAEAFTKGRMVRDALLLLPDRLAPHLAEEQSADAIHEMLTRELTEVLEALTLAATGATP